MGNFGLNVGVPWLSGTEGALCFICQESVDNVSHFLLECRAFRDNFKSVWSNLKQKITSTNPADGVQISNFINLGQQQKMLLLLEGISLPFDDRTVTLICRFICVAVGKVYSKNPLIRNHMMFLL